MELNDGTNYLLYRHPKELNNFLNACSFTGIPVMHLHLYKTISHNLLACLWVHCMFTFQDRLNYCHALISPLNLSWPNTGTVYP